MRSRSNAQRSILAAPYGGETYNWPYAARNIGYCAIWVCISSSSRKRTGDTETGWRPPPDKNIEPVPHWGKKIARGIPSCIWDVKQNGHSDSADLIGGKTPDRALWNARIHAKLHVQIQITSGSVLFLPLSFFILGKYNLI